MILDPLPEMPPGDASEGQMTARRAAMQDRLQWHPDAKLFGPSGRIDVQPGVPRRVIPEIPATAALCSALAASAMAMPFRIGGEGDPPKPLSQPSFETLTSGSTGSPRRIHRSHASWIACFQVNSGLFAICPGTRTAVLGQMAQSLALYGALEALHLGAEAHILSGLRPDRQHGALGNRAITHLYASPAQLRLLLDVTADPLPSLQTLLVGGSKLDPATRLALAQRFPLAAIREFYGAAETSFISLSDANTPDGSVGCAYPGVDIRILGGDGNAAERGQIWVRSPYLFHSYAGDPGHAHWQDDWLSVGEIGHIDDGYLYIAGRADRMLTIADQNVFPEEIEAFLLTLPGVTRAAVIAKPDRRRGHVFDAIVEGGEAAMILTACRAALGPLMAPRHLHRIPNWPLLSSGKTDLAALERIFG